VKLPKLSFRKKPKDDKQAVTVSGFRGGEKKRPKALGWDQRQQRVQRQRVAKFSSVKNFIREKKAIFIAIFIVFVVIFVGFFLVRFLAASGVFILQEVEVAGNEEIATHDVETVLDPLIGTSLFSFDARDVEALLKEQFSFIKEVYVRKVPPKLLEVEIEERYPLFQLVNLNGVYLVDEEGKFINSHKPETAFELTDAEVLILDGYGNADADYVYAYYLEQKLTQTEFVEVDWPAVPTAEKVNALAQMKDEITARVMERLNANLTSLVFTEFTDLPIVQSISTEEYVVGDNYSEERLLLLSEVKNFLATNSITVTKYYWASDFSLEVDVAPGGKLLFSITRNTKVQLDSLLAVWSEIGRESGKIIDLRSELVSVK